MKKFITQLKTTVLTFVALFFGFAAFAHQVDAYSSTCNGSTQYVVTATVSSVNSSSNYRWQWKNASGSWVCFTNGSNTINGTSYNVSGAVSSLTTTPTPITFTNPGSDLQGLEIRMVISDGNGVNPCNLPSGNTWTSTTNHFINVTSTNCATCTGAVTSIYFNEISGGTDLAIVNGGTYTVAQLGSLYNLEAGFSGTVGSMVFTVTGPTSSTNTENAAPYNSPATSSSAFTPAAGSYTVNVKSYNGSNATGKLCGEKTVTFTVTTADCSCPGNLITNGSFENGITGWNFTGGDFYTNTYVPVCGAKHGEFRSTSNQGGFYQELTNIAVGSVLTLNAYAGVHDASFDAYVGFYFINAAGTVLSTSLSSQVNNILPSMVQKTVVATVPVGTVKVWVGGYTTGNYLKTDQFCLTKVDPPVTFDCNCTGTNIVLNPSFENGTTSWSSAGGNLSAGTGAVACGAKSGDLENTTTTSKAWQVVGTDLPVGTVIAGSVYAGTHNASSDNYVGIEFLNASNVVLGTSVYVQVDKVLGNAPNGPQLYNITATVPAGTKYTRVVFGGNSSWTKTDRWCITKTEPTGSIGDRVWFDANGNGIQDATETIGIAGVTVQLLNTSNVVLATTTTNASGNYLFSSLAAGTYRVKFPTAINGSVVTGQNNGTDDTKDSDPSQSTGMTADIVLASGANDLTVDAGYCPTFLKIGDFVWNDSNNNGVQDAGEPGIAGAAVKLYADANGDNVVDGAAIATTTTDANGKYAFSNLAPGNFIVGVTKPTGFVVGATTNTSANPNSDNTTDNNGVNTVGTEVRSNFITITGGGEPTNDGDNSDGNLTLDFGFAATASIGDFVWNDLNGNGIQDAGEPGLAGVTVTLKDAAGATVGTTTTSAAGAYSFTNLAPGTYSVTFATPANYNASPSNQGTDDAKDSDPVAGVVSGIVLTAGQTNNTIDAGFVSKQLNVGDFVFYDANNNGVQDAGEPGIAGVTVKLYADANGDNVPDGVALGTVTTNASGIYAFTGLTPGNYIVGVTTPTGYAQGATTATSLTPNNDNNTDNNGITIAGTEVRSNFITLTTGGEPVAAADGDGNNGNLTLDFGFKGTAAIGNFVWNDTNQDGVQNAGEPGLAGVTVTLKNAAGTTVGTATTTGTGAYSFTNLAPGTYSVTFAAPTQYTASPAKVTTGGGNNGNDSDPVGGVVSNIVLTAGQINNDIDAGFYKLVNLYGNVWHDANALVDNQVNKTSNIPIPVGLNIYLVDAATNVVIDITGPENDGSYNFLNIKVNKTYKVVLSSVGVNPGQQSPKSVLPTGWRSTGENVGVGPGSGSDGVSNGLIVVDVEDVDLLNVNFGIRILNGEIVIG